MVSFLLRFFNTLNNKLRMKAERNGLKLIPEGLQGMPAHITSGNGDAQNAGMPVSLTAAQETRIGFPEMGSKVFSARHHNNF